MSAGRSLSLASSSGTKGKSTSLALFCTTAGAAPVLSVRRRTTFSTSPSFRVARASSTSRIAVWVDITFFGGTGAKKSAVAIACKRRSVTPLDKIAWSSVDTSGLIFSFCRMITISTRNVMPAIDLS